MDQQVQPQAEAPQAAPQASSEAQPQPSQAPADSSSKLPPAGKDRVSDTKVQSVATQKRNIAANKRNEVKAAMIAQLRETRDVPEALAKLTEAAKQPAAPEATLIQEAAPVVPEAPTAPAVESPVVVTHTQEDGTGAPSMPVAPSVTSITEEQRALAELTQLRIQAQKEKAEAQALLDAARKEKEEAAQKQAKLKTLVTDPVAWFAEAEIPHEDFKKLIVNGPPTPEQLRLRAIEEAQREFDKKFEAKFKALEVKEQQINQKAERAKQIEGIKTVLNDFPLAQRQGPEAVLAKALELSGKRNNQFVSFKEAAQAVEAQAEIELKKWLQDDKVRAKLNINTPPAVSAQSAPPADTPAVKSPTTLGRQTAPQAALPAETNPRDYAAKKAKYLALLAANGLK